ncbi:MAG: hypothetical protein II857_06000 [Selenomonadaceae bacterium]|nr:hypothetical protein [Selenomonadaceae bacterium]
MATVVEGAVIAGEKSNPPSVDYYRKCESCGYVSSSKYNTAALYHRYNSSFRCPKCGNNQRIEIRG